MNYKNTQELKKTGFNIDPRTGHYIKYMSDSNGRKEEFLTMKPDSSDLISKIYDNDDNILEIERETEDDDSKLNTKTIFEYDNTTKPFLLLSEVFTRSQDEQLVEKKITEYDYDAQDKQIGKTVTSEKDGIKTVNENRTTVEEDDSIIELKSKTEYNPEEEITYAKSTTKTTRADKSSSIVIVTQTRINGESKIVTKTTEKNENDEIIQITEETEKPASEYVETIDRKLSIDEEGNTITEKTHGITEKDELKKDVLTRKTTNNSDELIAYHRVDTTENGKKVVTTDENTNTNESGEKTVTKSEKTEIDGVVEKLKTDKKTTNETGKLLNQLSTEEEGEVKTESETTFKYGAAKEVEQTNRATEIINDTISTEHITIVATDDQGRPTRDFDSLFQEESGETEEVEKLWSCDSTSGYTTETNRQTILKENTSSDQKDLTYEDIDIKTKDPKHEDQVVEHEIIAKRPYEGLNTRTVNKFTYDHKNNIIETNIDRYEDDIHEFTSLIKTPHNEEGQMTEENITGENLTNGKQHVSIEQFDNSTPYGEQNLKEVVRRAEEKSVEFANRPALDATGTDGKTANAIVVPEPENS